MILMPCGAPSSAHAADDTLSVVYCGDLAPFEYTDKAGKPAGMLIDYWNLWSVKTGVKVNFIPAAWRDTLTMVKEGKADAHAGLFYNEERAAYLSYSPAPLTKTDTHIFYHESLPELAGGEELYAYRVGVLDDDYVEGFLEQTYPGISLVPYKDMDALMADLKSGVLKVFAVDTPVAYYALRQNGLSNEFQFQASKPLYQNDWLVAVPKGKLDVLKRIEEGMAKLTPREKLAISRKWSSSGESRDADTLVLAIDRNYPPFYFISPEGKPKGLFVDIWKLWAEKTETKVDFRPSNWAGTLEALKSGEADVHTGLYTSEERDKWIDFSNSFYEVPTRLYCKSDDTFVPLSEMKGKKVGAVAGSYQEDFLREKYPDVIVVPVPDTDGLILGLLKGDLDAFINGGINTDTVLAKLNLQGDIVGHSDMLYSNGFHSGTLKGNAELLNKINAGFDFLSNDELARLEARWITNPDNRYFGNKIARDEIGLTAKEQTWLAAHPTIRISNEMDWPPYDFVQDGKPAGWSVDYLKLIAEKMGVNIEWVNGYSWNELIQLGENKELDVIQCISKTPEREKVFNFTQSYHTSSVVIFTRPEDSSIKNIDGLKGAKVAVIKEFTQQKYLTKNYPEIEQVLVDNALEGLTAVSLGKADAYIDRQTVCQYYIKENNIPGVVFASLTGVPEFDIKKMNCSVRKDWPELVSILDKGMDSVPEEEVNALNQKWFGMATSSSGVNLTLEEKTWIINNPIIRVAATPDWPPFEFKEGNEYKGLAADILSLSAARTGLELDIQFNAWGDVLKGLKDKTLDVSPGIVKSEEREEYINFTDVSFVSQIAIWVKKTTQDIDSFDDLSDKIVAVEEGYFSHDLLLKKFPNIKLYLVKTPIDCVRAVSSGKADAYLGNQASTSYLMSQNVITNLKAVAYYDEGILNIRMGVRKDWPILVSILNKGIKTISLREKKIMLAQYVSVTSGKSNTELIFTSDEKKWIEDHKNIRLGVDPAWPPLEYFQGVTYSGLTAAYVKQLAKDTGLSFAPPPIVNWSETLRLAKEHKLDVLPSVTRTPEREKHLAFTESYSKFPLVVYQRTDSQSVKNMDELDGKSVAVVEGYAIEELLRDNHSDINLKPYMNLEKALMALSKGRVDALAGNFVAIEFLKQKLSLFNVTPTIKTPYMQKLRFGVRKDWGTLVRIINKWLATIDKATHERLAREGGVSLDTPAIAEGVEKPVDFTQLLLLGGGIIVAFGVSLIILIFLRSFVQSRAETLYSSHQYKVVGIVVGILFLCLVVAATWFALYRVENRARYAVGEVLESVLLTTHDALAVWSDQNKIFIKELAAMPTMRGLTYALLTLPEDKDVIEASPPLWNMRKLMEKVQTSRGVVGFSILSKNYLNYASRFDGNLLDKNVVSIQRPRLLDKAFLGDTIFIPPVRTYGIDRGDLSKELVTVVAFASPIKDSAGKIIAVLIVYYDVNEDYQRIISLGRIGETGETFTFDKNGALTSESRFDDLLRELGLIEKDQQGMLNLRLFDPGGNLLEGHVFNKEERLPLTVMAKSATAHKSGSNLIGYRDYRGVQVYGAWFWDSEFDLGIATEMDANEALGSYRLVRNTVIAIILITIMLGTLMTGLSNWIGQSAAKSLQKSKDELEDRVEERTAELKKISVAVEQSPAMVLITDTEGAIEYVNPKFIEVTGYTLEEVVGNNPRILKSGAHPKKFYEDLWNTLLIGKSWSGDILNKKKIGALFWVRNSIAPLFNDEGELTHFVAVMEDITDRKAQEERFQALLDAAPDAMVIVAQSGDITLVNIATEELFDYSREEMIGQKVEILLPDYIREDHPSHRGRFFATPGDMSLVAGKKFYGQTKSGDQIPVDISLNPIETEDGVQIIASIRDITERKKAEEAIARSEQRTRLILASAGDGIFGVDLEGKVTFINEAACSMVGYSSEELMGKPVHDIIHHSRPDGSFYPVEECPMRHAFTDGISSRIDDEVLWRKDKSNFYVEYSAVPILRDGEKVGAVISFQDISARRAMARALRVEKEKTDDALSVVTSSIQYASRIQRSVLPPEGRIEKFTSDHFVVWEPRDVVGGDLYWSEPWGRGNLLMLGDCTGHGVPGAFMTLLSSGALERALLEVPPGDSDRLVSRMHQMIQTQLGQHIDNDSDTGSDDGLELGICYVPPKGKTITFAGARMPLFIDNGESIEVIKSDKKGIAYRGIPFDFEYTNHTIEVADGMSFFMTTDGIIDQVGGDKGRGFGKKRFISLLESLRDTPLHKQGEKIYAELELYQGKEKRRDDVSLIGFKL